MDRTQRLVLVSTVLAATSCTMIGSAELSGPRVPLPDADLAALEAIPDAIPKVEPPSRTGNMAQYEQSGGTYRVLDTSEGYDERGVASRGRVNPSTGGRRAVGRRTTCSG